MKNSPKVSIVTITYNQAKYIEQALQSFVMQKTNFTIEVVVADDCSTDNTPKIIREFTKNYPNIFKPVLRQKNVGIQRNLNNAMRKAKGKYIALCEGDDYWTDPRKLQKQVDFLEERPDYALCFHPVSVEYNDKKNNYIFPEAGKISEFTLENLLSDNYIQTNSVMYRRQKYENMPVDILPLDWYLHLYHARFGKIGFIDEVMSVYRRHPYGIWWDSSGNIDEIWKKYSAEHTHLFIELLKLYGDNSEHREILYAHIGTILNSIIRIDIEQKTGLLEKLLKTLPEQTGLFLEAQNQLLQNLERTSDQQLEKIQSMTEKINLKEAELAELRKKLRLIELSRVWKTRNQVRKSLDKLIQKSNLNDSIKS